MKKVNKSAVEAKIGNHSIVVKDFSYRMNKELYNALATDPKHKEPIKYAHRKRGQFDHIVLAALNAENRGRRIVSLIVE